METGSSTDSDTNTECALQLDRNHSYMISTGLSRVRGRPEGHQGTLIIRGGFLDFPGGSDGKASACNVGDPGLIAGSGKSLGEGNGNPLQCSYLENTMDGGAWWVTVWGCKELDTAE